MHLWSVRHGYSDTEVKTGLRVHSCPMYAQEASRPVPAAIIFLRVAVLDFPENRTTLDRTGDGQSLEDFILLSVRSWGARA